MPSKIKVERAKRLGLCVECCSKPTLPGKLWCKRCTRSNTAKRQAYKRRRGLLRRLAYAHTKLLATYGRAIVAAQLAGAPTPPPPTLPEWIPPAYYWLDRHQPYTRRTPRARYKYKPRPLPITDNNVVKCLYDLSSEAVEFAGVQSGHAPLAP